MYIIIIIIIISVIFTKIIIIITTWPIVLYLPAWLIKCNLTEDSTVYL